MVTINNRGYLIHKTRSKTIGRLKASKRIWWLVKYDDIGNGVVNLGRSGKVCLPKEYAGKKVGFKLIIINNKSKSPA